MGTTRIIEWSDPPFEPRGRPKALCYPPLLDWMKELMTRPGEWAKIDDNLSPATVGARMDRLKISLIRRDVHARFELTTRKVSDTESCIWGRYL